MPDAMPARQLLPCPHDGWGILAQPPGNRDLVQLRYWVASRGRSHRRRMVRTMIGVDRGIVRRPMRMEKWNRAALGAAREEER